NICTLYDVGEQAGTAHLVMEYLEGETLEQRRLKKGALPLDEALNFAIQIADGFGTAHRCGIVHRDLKPGNVMVNDSPDAPTLINRCDKSQTCSARLAAGTLPEGRRTDRDPLG